MQAVTYRQTHTAITRWPLEFLCLESSHYENWEGCAATRAQAPIAIYYRTLFTLAARYPALASYRDLAAVEQDLAADANALDALCVAYREETEPEIKEGSFCLLVVALGESLLRLAPRARDGGEILAALWRAVLQPGAPLLLAISRDLANTRQKDARRSAREELVGSYQTATPPPNTDPWLRRDVMAAVATLSDQDRQLFALLAAELTQVEIAKRLSQTEQKTITPATVWKRTERLRKRLSEQGVRVSWAARSTARKETP